MPFQPPRPCTYPGCNRLTKRGRCDSHRTAPDERRRASRYDHQWQKVRDHYIRNHPVCEIREKCDGDPAEEVDHKRAIANGGEMYDEDNLQSTCRPCHAWKTREIDGFTGRTYAQAQD